MRIDLAWSKIFNRIQKQLTEKYERKLQELLFPGGILFDRQFNNYRTRHVNSVLELTHSLSNDLGARKKGQIKKLSNFPHLVARSGRISNQLTENLLMFKELAITLTSPSFH
jgi:hypothetical protein